MAGRLFRTIWRLVEQIPPGQVATYGQVADMLGRRQDARVVGWALHSLPAGSAVPWHRVVSAAGCLHGASEAARLEQQALLEEEGVTVGCDGRIALERCRWQGLPALEVEALRREVDNEAQGQYTQ
ncbi:MAG: MGMT family protein [Chloroflexi bacterium]|nr:MGMT family protein [Chloroflexota bacterium]